MRNVLQQAGARGRLPNHVAGLMVAVTTSCWLTAAQWTTMTPTTTSTSNAELRHCVHFVWWDSATSRDFS